MMGSKECSCVSLLLYLYFIIVSLEASGAIHATKEKPHNHYHLDAGGVTPRSISNIIQALCNNGCVWCYIKNPSSTDSSASIRCCLAARTLKC